MQQQAMSGFRKLQLGACYSQAWKSFSKWWIPLCLLAALLMFFEWIPRLSARGESQQLAQALSEVVAVYSGGEQSDMALEQLEEVSEALSDYSQKLLRFSFYAAPFVALLSVALIGTALMAVDDRRTRLAPKRVLAIGAAQLGLAIVKMFLLVFLFPLGVFVYIQLYFAIPLMLEEGASASEAIRESWRMTRGNFWRLFGLVSINTLIQFLMGLTLVGFIPATGFAQTARAAAFKLLREPVRQ